VNDTPKLKLARSHGPNEKAARSKPKSQRASEAASVCVASLEAGKLHGLKRESQ
jgi:hypothetical protein